MNDMSTETRRVISAVLRAAADAKDDHPPDEEGDTYGRVMYPWQRSWLRAQARFIEDRIDDEAHPVFWRALGIDEPT